MKYYKLHKTPETEPIEVTKEEAYQALKGYWEQETLKEIFDKEYGFRLYTPFADFWTMNEKGMVPMAGWYGYSGK